MRRKLAVLILVAVALLLVAGPALAASSGQSAYASKKTTPPKAHIISLSGYVQSNGGAFITVSVRMTNKAFRSFRGKLVTVYRANSTTYLWTDRANKPVEISFSQLLKDDYVCVNGLVVTEYVVNARRIDKDKFRKR